MHFAFIWVFTYLEMSIDIDSSGQEYMDISFKSNFECQKYLISYYKEIYL